MELNFFSAFIIGLMGSGHCITMCGGISTMLTSSIKKQTKRNTLYVVSYNLGRIFSYMVIGAIAGLTGSLAAKSIGLPIASLQLIAGIFLILFGLYIGQWLMWITQLEHIGKALWQKISPYSKHCLPVNSVNKAFLLGGLWGWLPCGLVYSTLTWSMASGDTLSGALIMLSFGLGTLPALFTVSFSMLWLQTLLKNNKFKKVVALMLITYGLITLKFAYELLF